MKTDKSDTPEKMLKLFSDEEVDHLLIPFLQKLKE